MMRSVLDPPRSDLFGPPTYVGRETGRGVPDLPDGEELPGGAAGGPSVVYFREEGTMYDAPIDALWAFMNWDGHGTAHVRSVRNFSHTEESPNRFVVTFEVRRGGDWRRISCRAIDFPPLGRMVEEVAGPYTGTQVVFLYTPVGPRTRLDITARFVSHEFGPVALRRHMVDSLETSGVEDEPYLQEFLERRARP